MNTKFIEGMKGKVKCPIIAGGVLLGYGPKPEKPIYIYLVSVPIDLEIKPTQMEEDKKWIGHGLDGSEF